MTTPLSPKRKRRRRHGGQSGGFDVSGDTFLLQASVLVCGAAACGWGRFYSNAVDLSIACLAWFFQPSNQARSWFQAFAFEAPCTLHRGWALFQVILYGSGEPYMVAIPLIYPGATLGAIAYERFVVGLAKHFCSFWFSCSGHTG
jgi:hypothetical protein